MNPTKQFANLEEMITAAGGAIKLLRNSPFGTYVFPVLAPEYTNWRDEQRAWKESVALLDLSYHQTDLYIRGGADALKLFSRVGMNRWGTFPTNRGKQIIACSPDGFLIGDGICFHLEDDLYRVAGPPVISDWVQYNAEAGKYDVELDRDETVSFRPGAPRIYIYQIQGPQALKVMTEVTENKLPEIGFFHIGRLSIKGKQVRALRHGMAGEPGFELFGPWEDAPVVREALEKVGARYGMKNVGGLAYGTTAFESGWLPLPLPAIYHSAEMQGFRRWLPQRCIEGMGSLGGSFYSDNLVDYYMDPVEVGYGRLIDFDHDFIGREALAQKVKNNKRKKVTLVWNSDDVTAVINSSLFSKTNRAKYINTPLAAYAVFQYDQVLKQGRHAGVSSWCGYSANASAFISLSLVDVEHAEIGSELTLVWGETHSNRGPVEKHDLKEIRATVAPAPYFEKLIKKD